MDLQAAQVKLRKTLSYDKNILMMGTNMSDTIMIYTKKFVDGYPSIYEGWQVKTKLFGTIAPLGSL